MTVLWITLFYILFYFTYPIVLLGFSFRYNKKDEENREIDSVSLILMSYNGKVYLKDKINFLLKELSVFRKFELIIIDDYSSDNSREILDRFKNIEGLSIIYKKKQRGIPHSMNMGVKKAKYETIVFCDQRQNLSENILRNIVEPLKKNEIGAVSGYISHFDKKRNISFLRLHENFIKSIESKLGCLIGVYGPFYALKKSCYSAIPENIILDDLYLSLNVLKTDQIKLCKECEIFDDNFSLLYDYKRTKRYLIGFLQILKDKTLMQELRLSIKVMLIWHKYVRLIIPLLLFLSFINIALLMTKGIEFVIIFSIVSLLILVSLFPKLIGIQTKLQNFVRMNIFYFFAIIDLFFNKLFSYKQVKVEHELNIVESEEVKANK